MRVIIEREQINKEGFVVLDWIINVNRIILLNNTTGVLEIDKHLNLKRPISEFERDSIKRDKDKIIDDLCNCIISEWSNDPRSFEEKRLSANRKRIVLEELKRKEI